MVSKDLRRDVRNAAIFAIKRYYYDVTEATDESEGVSSENHVCTLLLSSHVESNSISFVNWDETSS